jgi:CRP-like cAMP-binding protein
MKIEPRGDGLLHMLPHTVASRLESRGRQRHFDPGEVLFSQGEPNHYLHAIVRGRVKVERVYPNLLPTMVLAEVGPGEVAGEEGLLYGSLRRTTATNVGETDTLEVPQRRWRTCWLSNFMKPPNCCSCSADRLVRLSPQVSARRSRRRKGVPTQARPSRLGEVVDKRMYNKQA